MPNYTFTGNYLQVELWRKHFRRFRKQPVHFLEVGTFEGRTAIWFLNNILTHPQATITCVDPFVRGKGREAVFDRNIQRSGHASRVTKIAGYSTEVLRTLPLDHFHIVYIDGDHTAPAVLTDAVMAWPLLRLNGVMFFDDYPWAGGRTRYDRPQLAIDAFLQVFRKKYHKRHHSWQVIVEKIAQ